MRTRQDSAEESDRGGERVLVSFVVVVQACVSSFDVGITNLESR